MRAQPVANRDLMSLYASEDERKLDTSLPVVQYIRRSSQGQKKNNLMSLIQQDNSMRARLEVKGFTEFELIDTDDGTSGQKALEDRAGLTYLYDLIKGKKLINGKRIGAVAAYDASRLWRDTTRVWYNEFIQLIIKYHVPVIFHNRTFYPESSQDMDMLRAEFEGAIATLKQITEKANPARLEAVWQGSYGGGNVPAGFIIAGTKSNYTFQAYEPHKQVIEYLFKRYKALNGNLPRLLRECQDSNLCLPEFDSSVTNRPNLALTHVPGKGYPIRTRDALVSILTNKAYIGHYVYNVREEATIHHDERLDRRVKTLGAVKVSYVNESHHDALIDRSLFDYAYQRLTGQTVEGETVEVKQERRYGMQTRALLEGVLKSGDCPVYAMAGKNLYVARTDTSEDVVAVKIEQLDTVFSTVMARGLAQGWFSGNCDLIELVEKAVQDTANKKVDLNESLNVVNNGIHGWELDKASCRETGNVHGLNDANKQLAVLYARRDRLQSELEQASSDSNLLGEAEDLVEQAMTNWHGMKFEKQRMLVKTLVCQADISEVSPHILKLELLFAIGLKSKGAPVHMAFYFYRNMGSKEAWTDEENVVLRRMYASSDRADILQSLPTRAWKSIIMQCSDVLHISRQTYHNTSDIPDTMCLADVDVIRSLGMSPKTALWPVRGNIDQNLQRRGLMRCTT